MASDEAIRKMVHAIMDKRRELGIIDWGTVPPEEVIKRLNKEPNEELNQEPSEPGSTPQSNNQSGNT